VILARTQLKFSKVIRNSYKKFRYWKLKIENVSYIFQKIIKYAKHAMNMCIFIAPLKMPLYHKWFISLQESDPPPNKMVMNMFWSKVIEHHNLKRRCSWRAMDFTTWSQIGIKLHHGTHIFDEYKSAHKLWLFMEHVQHTKATKWTLSTFANTERQRAIFWFVYALTI
jgi:hypothetical protein